MSILYDDLSWQGPVCTELEFYKQNKNNSNYFGFPWANGLDGKISNWKKVAKDLYDGKKGEEYYTCCQHISFKNILKEISEKFPKIKTLYTPHKIIGEDSFLGVELKYCPLYAVNIEDLNRNRILIGRMDREFLVNSRRKYLYSFVGAYQGGYLTNIRPKLFEIHSFWRPPENGYEIFVKMTGDWHFNSIVYNTKPRENLTKEMEDYNILLLTSDFSLCPSGSGPNSIRLWESLALGSIPVVLANTLHLHPEVEDAIIHIDENKIDTKKPDYLFRFLSGIADDEKKKMRENCIRVYHKFKNNFIMI